MGAADDLAVLAADDHVVARAGRDHVAAAVVGARREDPIDVGRVRVVAGEARRVRALGRRPVDQAAVADHEVVAVAGVDRVAVDPAEDDVVAEPVVIESAPPISDSIVCTRPSVIGSAPKRDAFEAAA